MEQTDALTLLRQIEFRLARMEQRQAAARRRAGIALGLVVLLLAGLGVWLAPRVIDVNRQYKEAMTTVQQLNEAAAGLDFSRLSDSLQQLQQLGAQLTQNLDAETLQQLGEALQTLDSDSLTEALAVLGEVDMQRFGEGVQQLETLLNGLGGLDAEAINTAVQNLNKALEPILRMFGGREGG